ncbi:MAG: sialate O-acetylesterase [Bacteroidales bacterium]|jgi:sialate O-acetylesterase
MKTFIKRASLLITVLFIFLQLSKASISLPEIFSDNMVLQQKSDIIIWGWAKTGEKVIIKADWMDTEITTQGSTQGTWKITMKTPAAGGPYNIHIKGQNELILKNVLIGEVWLCSGQSNMEMSAQWGINNGDEEIKNANYPEIRFFTVSASTSHYPQDHLAGKWSVCTPDEMRTFSAIGYFFARKLNKELGVPIGIINSSWGGTPAEAWMPEEVIQKDGFLREAAAKQKTVPWGPVEPARIYNAMINPLIPFHIAGVLWYQGEANTINSYAYKELLSGLIKSWRNNWGYDFPFYFAQIAPYKYGNPYEGVEVRDAQRRVLEVPNTGMAVLSDLCDTLNIHPKNKQDAALRLANIALNRYYKKAIPEDSGPLYKEMTIDKDKAIISFDHSEGLHAAGGKLTYFEIAGADKVFYPAEAKIKDQKVIVTSKKVKTPVAVRFAWRNTATPNLFNGANLPASCFTTK